MKKFLTKLFTGLGILSISIVTVSALSITSSCTLKIGQSSVSTDSVGVSKSAEAYGKCYSNSERGCNFYVMAAWTGWPYSREFGTAIHPGDEITHNEEQSKNSNFYVELENFAATGYKAQAYGKITAK